MAVSNISRDHIAMEAMKVLMEKTVSNNLTLKKPDQTILWPES